MINAFNAYTRNLACRKLAKMHAAPYGTRLWRARSEPEPSRTRHGALLGVPVALSLAVDTVENVRVCGWLFGR